MTKVIFLDRAWEEIRKELVEELQILNDLHRADEEIDAGIFLTHEEVRQETVSWNSK